MSEKIIKWGFIGCGEVTKTKSGPAFQKSRTFGSSSRMSRDGAKAKAYAKERGIKRWYDDAQELIDDPEVNAIYIATPPSSHATYAIMSMKKQVSLPILRNRWPSHTKNVRALTAYPKKREFPVSLHTTAVIFPTSRKSKRIGRKRNYR